MEVIDMSLVLAIIGGLVLATNVITEVIKHSLKDFPAQILALVVSMTLTMFVFFGFTSYMGIAVTWYMVVGAAVAGLFVSYGAQFGYDKLQEALEKIIRNTFRRG